MPQYISRDALLKIIIDAAKLELKLTLTNNKHSDIIQAHVNGHINDIANIEHSTLKTALRKYSDTVCMACVNAEVHYHKIVTANDDCPYALYRNANSLYKKIHTFRRLKFGNRDYQKALFAWLSL